MLDKLKIAKQAVEENGLIEAMQCYHFYGNRVQTTSSRITIDCISNFTVEKPYSVNASRFLAVKSILGEKHETVIESSKMRLFNDSYKASIEMLKEPWGLIKAPQFTAKNIVEPELLNVLKIITPFISKDPAKPELCSVLIKNKYAYAMSYAWAVKIPTKIHLEFAIPYYVAPVLTSMEMDPFAIVIQDDGVYFFYEDSTWIKYTTFSQGWPPVETILEDVDASDVIEVPKDFGGIVNNLVRAVKLSTMPIKAVIFDKNGIRGNDESFAVNWHGMIFGDAIFHCDVIETIANNCTAMDIAKYPDKMPFIHKENNLIGVAMGMQLL